MTRGVTAGFNSIRKPAVRHLTRIARNSPGRMRHALQLLAVPWRMRQFLTRSPAHSGFVDASPGLRVRPAVRIATLSSGCHLSLVIDGHSQSRAFTKPPVMSGSAATVTATPPPSMSVSVLTQSRIFPIPPHQTATDGTAQAQCVPLSIVDQTLGGGPLAGCVWLWDAAPTGALDTQQLTASLRHTLASYPFCGQLEPRPYDPHGDHTQRPGCLQLRWNTPADPGAELVIARSAATLAAVAPSFTDRAQRSGGVWINESWRKAELFSSTPLASTGVEYEGWPCMSVQLTEFGCGGLAMSARWPHTLCDMSSIMSFMRNWATVHTALLAGRDPASAIPPDSLPRFEPELVDHCAAGDVRDRSKPADQALLQQAATLPRAHWDWWATSEADCPPPMRPLTRIPPQFTAQQAQPLGEPATWLRTWQWSDTAHTCLIDFSRQELDAMLAEARTAGRVSVNDVVLAHVGSEVCRARGMQEDDEAVHLTLALNLRPRLTPPLPVTYVGSPIVDCMVTHTGREWCTLPLSQLALSVRSALSCFTPAAVQALLYDMARELTPHRRLMYCVGRHLCTGSWEREGVYELDFGTERGPRLVQYGPGPDMEGVVHTMKPGKEDGDGLSVLVAQRLEVLQRLVRSETLRRFKSAATTQYVT